MRGIQRVRIGLTGLAFVFVLVLLAAVFSSPSNEEPITANTIALGTAGASSAAIEEAEPKEPLAELGVAPGNVDANMTIDSGAAPQAPQR